MPACRDARTFLPPGSAASLGALVLAVNLACSGGKDAPAPQPLQLTGTFQEKGWSSGPGGLVRPRYLDNYIIEAHVPDGRGGWTLYPGVGSHDGTYRVDGVPAGDHWLRMDLGVNGSFQDLTREFLWTDQAQVDWNYDVHTRRDEVDLQAMAYPGTTLTLEATGLSPVEEGDLFGMAVPQADLVRGGKTYLGSWTTLFDEWSTLRPPAVGDTTLVGTTLDWGIFPVIRATDTATLFQMRQANASGISYKRVITSVALPSFEVPDQAAATVTGIAFGPAPALAYSLQFPRSAWAAAASTVGGANARVDSSEALVAVMVGGLERGRAPMDYAQWEVPLFCPAGVRYFPDVFQTHGAVLPEGVSDVATGDLGLGNPFPAAWTFEHYQMNFLTEVGPSGAAWTAWIGWDRPLGAPGPVLPPLLPVSGATVNGQALDQTRLGVGAEPELSWTAPSVGSPTSYEVALIDWNLSSIAGPGSVVVTLWVPGELHSVRMPHDVLLAGHVYSLRITAHAMAGQDIRKAPHRLAMPHAYASHFTAMFTR